MEKIIAIQPDGEKTRILIDLSRDRFPTRVIKWFENLRCDSQRATRPVAWYGFVTRGVVDLEINRGINAKVATNSYFAAGSFEVTGGEGIVVEICNNKCLPMISGPIEDRGRIPYINGCTDTVLISPPQKGDACMNLLHIPPRARQTEHVHPSLRIGLVIRGECICRTNDVPIVFKAGMVFYIPENTKHALETTDSEMLAVAFHPDSDFGPTPNDHPMLNRTIVDGVSAKNIESIKTK